METSLALDMIILWYGERQRRIICTQLSTQVWCSKDTWGRSLGDNIWCVVDGIMDVNERNWTAVLEVKKEETKEGASRNGHLKRW